MKPEVKGQESETFFRLKVFGMALLACMVCALFAVQKYPVSANDQASAIEYPCRPLP